jgi:hypothetical protein
VLLGYGLVAVPQEKKLTRLRFGLKRPQMKKRLRQNNLTRYRNITYPSSSSHAHLTHSNFNYNYLHACINRYDVYVEHIRIVRSFRSLFTNLVFSPFSYAHHFPFTYLSNRTHLNVLSMFACVCVCVCVCMKYKGTEQENIITLCRIPSLVRISDSP